MSKEFQQSVWDALVEDDCRRLVRSAVLEDLDRGLDWTTVSLVPMEAVGRANIVARHSGVVAGLPAAQVVIDEMDRRVRLQPLVDDGSPVERGTALASVDGPARSLLTAERPMLNFVGHLSGIATVTKRFVDAVSGTKARIYDTRKTTPGWRRLEKYAVRQGGGQNHRAGLFDAMLIKDNHLALGGALTGRSRFTPAEAVRHARQFLAENFPTGDPRREMIVEVEVDSLAQLEQVLPARPDIVLLDNMPPEMLRQAVELRDVAAPEVQLEASGGVALETVARIAATGVERISAGALTHSAAWFDVALDWQ
ncbi:MAG: carboxylating nicotinate-nucleotide diphosphorylase [Pirellulales bacterium]|nr:carboxylating nicotinate-nucleotide diphosphorylase [Pirellulales bacterium]